MIDKHAASLFVERYRSLAPEGGVACNEVIGMILAHRSVRAFAGEAVCDEVLSQLVAAAQSAATSSNLQAWSVIAVRDEQHKARLAELCDNQKFILQAPLFLVWCADLSRARRVSPHQLDGADYLEAFLLSVVDVSLAAQNAAVAAESLGLGICYVGAVRNHPLDIAKELNLPPGVFGVFGMSVGHPDPAKPAAVRPRLPQSVVLHFEHYGTKPEAKAIAAYNEAQGDFQKEQGMKLIDWTSRVASRLKDAASLDGRDILRQALQALGFKLR
jgi:nitroreductase